MSQIVAKNLAHSAEESLKKIPDPEVRDFKI